jgi:hypothetical protein
LNNNELPDPGISKQNAVTVEEEVVPLLVNTARNDSSLIVRAQAIQGLNEFFAGSTGFPDSGLDLLELSGLNDWWNRNSSDYKALEWISRMRFRIDRPNNPVLDSVNLYDQLTKVKASSSAVQESLRNTILQLQYRAAEPTQASLESLQTRIDRGTCDSVKADLSFHIMTWEDPKEPRWQELADQHSVYEIAFLKSCPVDTKFVNVIADYGTRSISLGKRYSAVVVINTWLGKHFDPLDVKDFQSWWVNNKNEFGQQKSH